MESIDDAELARLRSLPWIVSLDAGDLSQLIAEYEGALREAYRTGDRRPLDRVLETWRMRSVSPSPAASSSS